ncbi:MAG TPA: 3'-5' exonuclease [Phototrophicaceae bacterium]|nr:3'-5' exonuclease [Phototrophicaceae bacterium]
MTRKYDQIIVIDIECTCWEKLPPAGQKTDIIEIGICPLDVATGMRLEKRSLIVKPERSTVSPFCTQLTTLTQEQVDQGMAFMQACNILRYDYQTRKRVWASYGDFDRQRFEIQCAEMGIEYPFGASHLNVKTWFTLLRGLRHDVGMADALRLLGLELEGTHHRGHDDAWNIAQIMAVLLAERRTA